MRLGLIDIGTNSIRLDVYHLYDGAEPERLQRIKEMVRLGQDVFVSGELHPEGMKRTLKALEQFKRICDDLCVDSTEVIATSALRQAKNSHQFIKRVYEKTGLEIEVISGKQEAQLILDGIRQDWRTGAGNFGFIDIGGGSTEIGVLTAKQTVFLDSLQLGASRLQQEFFCESTSRYAVGECRRRVIDTLQQAFKGRQKTDIPLMLGSSGTINALQKIFRTAGKGAPIRLKPLTDLISELASMSLAQRKKFPGLNAKRADIIIPGAIILHETMLFLRTPTVHFTKFALRDGLLFQAMEKQRMSVSRKSLKRLK